MVIKQSKFNTDASHLTYICKRRPSVWRLVITIFYNAFPQSAQSAEMLQTFLLPTDQKRRFVVYEHD